MKEMRFQVGFHIRFLVERLGTWDLSITSLPGNSEPSESEQVDCWDVI